MPAYPQTATCSCGALSATVTGDPFSVAVCSCQECQRRTGSAFGYSAYWEDALVSIAGESKAWNRISDEGRHLEFHFCPTCGYTLWWKAEFLPGHTAVALGNFADGSLFAPTAAVWDKRRHSWLEHMPELRSFSEGRF